MSDVRPSKSPGFKEEFGVSLPQAVGKAEANVSRAIARWYGNHLLDLATRPAGVTWQDKKFVERTIGMENAVRGNAASNVFERAVPLLRTWIGDQNLGIGTPRELMDAVNANSVDGSVVFK